MRDRYGARFGAVARRYIGGNPVGSLGGTSVCYRSAEPESRSHVSEPAASSAAAGASSANDTISGSDTASSPIATAKSSAEDDDVGFPQLRHARSADNSRLHQLGRRRAASMRSGSLRAGARCQRRARDERTGVAAFQQHTRSDGAAKETTGVSQHLVFVAELEHES